MNPARIIHASGIYGFDHAAMMFNLSRLIQHPGDGVKKSFIVEFTADTWQITEEVE